MTKKNAQHTGLLINIYDEGEGLQDNWDIRIYRRGEDGGLIEEVARLLAPIHPAWEDVLIDDIWFHEKTWRKEARDWRLPRRVRRLIAFTLKASR